MKNVCSRNYSAPYFLAFSYIRTEYGEMLCMQSECRKIRTKITPNMDTFYAVKVVGTISTVTRSMNVINLEIIKNNQNYCSRNLRLIALEDPVFP